MSIKNKWLENYGMLKGTFTSHLPVNNTNQRETKSKVFPMPLKVHFALILLSMISAFLVYGCLSNWIHNKYLNALENAQVIQPFLSNFGNSGHFNCDSDLHKNDNCKNFEVPKELTPRDLSSLMVAAKIMKKQDVDDVNQILSLKKGGVGAWMATGLLATKFEDGTSLSRVLIDGRIETNEVKNVCSSADKFVNIGSLTSLLEFYKTMGNTSNGGVNKATCYHPVSLQVRNYAHNLAKALVGKAPALFYPLSTPKPENISSIIKQSMKLPWNLYNNTVMGATDKKRFECINLNLNEFSYVKSADETGNNTSYKSGDSIELKKEQWFKDDPSKFYDAIFSLSYLIINEVQRDKKVKLYRFSYQAIRGPIQVTLIVLILYIFSVILWRLFASFKKTKVADGKKLPMSPVLIHGEIESFELQMLDSRRLIDQLIGTLPLIGLFGTVVGILLGLPNASAAITATGPNANETVTALFEQLGLAFSTTAIAIMGVILLELLWENTQQHEDHSIWRLQNPIEGDN